jgi:UDP-glucose:(heptosyl)LPS alpha-1,3-glucosyltransferase
MRIAVVCRPFVYHGGVETATAGLLSELALRGYSVDLITTPPQHEMPGVTIRPLAVPHQPSLVRLLAFAMAARAATRRGNYDIVQSHERCLDQDVYRAGEGTHRGYLAAMGRRLPKANPYHRMVMWLESGIFRLQRARHIVAISRLGKQEIERLYGPPAEHVSVVYNGVDLVRFHPERRSGLGESLRRELGLDGSAWTVLFVGSGFERKGLGPLIEGVSLLKAGKTRLLVAGKGRTEPFRSLADRLGIASQILWLGPRPDVERLYAVADAVALPARYEPFGNVHLEALASGVPVLSSRRAGGSELIADGENGAVVEEISGRSIAEALRALRDGDPASLAVSARAKAAAFTHAAQVDALVGLYRRLPRNLDFH